MIIQGQSYQITYPLSCTVNLSFVDVQMSSGLLRRFDRDNDWRESVVQIKDDYQRIANLSRALSLQKIQSITLQENEHIFGADVPSDSYSVLVIGEPDVQRIDLSFSVLSVRLACNDFVALQPPSSTLESMLFPEDYQSIIDRETVLGVYTNGDLRQTQKPVAKYAHVITFSLDQDRAIWLMAHMTQTVRANAFEIGDNWRSLKPFAGSLDSIEQYAYMIGLRCTKNSIKEYQVSIDLERYEAV